MIKENSYIFINDLCIIVVQNSNIAFSSQNYGMALSQQASRFRLPIDMKILESKP